MALFGLGAIRDERLNRMLSMGRVKWCRPAEDPDGWFNLFCIHQNRDDRGRGAKNCVKEDALPGFLDLVVRGATREGALLSQSHAAALLLLLLRPQIWGHEHHSRLKPEQSLGLGEYFISQPGSSVATSLVEGEAEPKKVGLLEIRGKMYRMTALELQRVRPFVIDGVMLDNTHLDKDAPNVSEQLEALLESRINGLVERAAELAAPELPKELRLPLVRLKVDLGSFSPINAQRFEGRFVGKVFCAASSLEPPQSHASSALLLVSRLRMPAASCCSRRSGWCAAAPPRTATTRVQQRWVARFDSQTNPF